MIRRVDCRYMAVAAAAALLVGFVKLLQAQESDPATLAIIGECKERLPENKRYTMNIDFHIDTREGEESTLEIVLLDDDAPESLDVPVGTEDFVNCVLRTLGIPDSQI